MPKATPRNSHSICLDRSVLRTWRERGLRPSTVAVFSSGVRRFIEDCSRLGVRAEDRLTRRDVDAFSARYARRNGICPVSCRARFRSAIRAWSCAISAAGTTVSPWIPRPVPRARSGLVGAFIAWRCRNHGVAQSTSARDEAIVDAFLRFVRGRGRRVRFVLEDVDAFVLDLRHRFAVKTIARMCCGLRAFFRFLHATGRLKHDLASSVLAPRYRRSDRPPRALPWSDVRAIVRSVDRHRSVGRRDYALLLMMATYGLGAAEIGALRLRDLDWAAATVLVRRPKTGVEIVLPLLPAIARALVDYLRHGRPRRTGSDAVFLCARAPYGPMIGSSTIRHIVRVRARAVGVVAPILGAHVFRHSHASRQIDSGVPQKVVGDILGHRSPHSTSVYVGVALRRLRTLALPVPS